MRKTEGDHNRNHETAPTIHPHDSQTWRVLSELSIRGITAFCLVVRRVLSLSLKRVGAAAYFSLARARCSR